MNRTNRWLPLLLAMLLIALSGCALPIPTETSATPTPTPSATPSPTPVPTPTPEPVSAYVAKPATRAYVKLSDMEYARPLLEDARALTDAFLEEFRASPDGDAQIDRYIAYSRDISKMQDMYVLALIDFYRDVNEDTQVEFDYCSDFEADFSEIQNEVYAELLKSPYVDVLSEYFGEDMMESIRYAVEMFDEEMVELYRQVYKLRNEYTRLQTDYAKETISYGGIDFTVNQLIGQILYDSVANPRRAAELNRLLTDHVDVINEQCNDIYSQMLTLRTQSAKIAGFDNYVDYALSEGSYDVATIKQFVSDVRDTMIPLMNDMRDRAETIMGEPINASNYSIAMFAPSYASELVFDDPQDSAAAAEQKRYDAAMDLLRGLMPETAELVDYLEEFEMIDVFSRAGKSGGAFTVTFPYLQQPFIFSDNMNISTIIHESGHALDAYNYPLIDLQERYSAGSEISEVHSMGLEVLSLNDYESLYGDTADIAVMSELYDGFSAIMSQTMYYEFELALWENPEMTRTERNELFSGLSAEYGQSIPGLSIYDEYGGYWVMISHLFEQPLYTIDYSLSQIVSFEIYEIALEDQQSAEDVYMKFLLDNATLDLNQRLNNAGLVSPFELSKIKEIARMLRDVLLSDEYWEPLGTYVQPLAPAA